MNFAQCFLACLTGVLSTTSLLVAEETKTRTTYCNPLPLPNFPIGRFARDLTNGDTGPDWMWRLGYKQQFRELADVTALWHESSWYLFPSVDMAWTSKDNGATWEHHPINVRDIGYAPTVVKHQNKFLLMASDSPIYQADHPLGPYVELGTIELKRTANMPPFIDPMLYSDTDGRLYYYWGCSPTGGIWGVELDAANPTKPIGAPHEMISFRPDIFPWEAVGQWNQNTTIGWVEGAWMVKNNNKYYLTYCAGGTENRTYAMGCYTSDSALGPFVPQKTNPIFRTVDGLVTGTAHGSIVSGPNDELWVFYSVRASVVHAFERRLGMDRAHISDSGELVISEATSTPQPMPGVENVATAATSWLPLNGDLRTIGSTNAPNLEGRFAVDNSLVTWWEPAAEDRQPTLTTQFMTSSSVRAVRLVWRDVGLDTKSGVHAGPIRYQVELEDADGTWTTVIDRRHSDEDLMIDYREIVPKTATKARLTVLEWPTGITPAVAEFTVFGETIKSD